MGSSQNSDLASSPPLLPDFLSVRGVLDLPNVALVTGKLVNVFGHIKEFQPPCKTSRPDWKCTIEIVDSSVRYDSSGLKLNIFWPLNHMPRFGAGDAVLIRNGKAQIRYGIPSLLTNFATEIHLLSAAQIPASSPGPSTFQWQSFPPKRVLKLPTPSETNYVIHASEHTADLPLLSTMEFQQRSEQAMNIKDKFALLKDIKVDRFYNILGQVIQVYDAPSGQLTLHFSDYTANSEFYNHVWGDVESTTTLDGDDYGYIKSRPKPVSNWPGPYGKMSIQLTLFDEHADFAREHAKAESWVLLKNVKISHGKVGGCLEGRLHGDGGRVHVEIMERPENKDDMDPRWKEATRRKLDWMKKFEKDKQRIRDEESSTKRKREEEPLRQNSKARRKEKRAGIDGKESAKEQIVRARLDLNEHIRCEDHDKPIVLLADILKPRTILHPNDNVKEFLSPFDIRKCKANVRVVGYFPPKIENFAVGHRPSDFDMLSDYSGNEDTDPEETMRAFRSGKGLPGKVWEWRFALQVVDATDKAFEQRTWVVVNNYDAQMLLDMDATNLHRDRAALHQLKERLCILWGDLEEQIFALASSETLKIQGSMEATLPPASSYKAGEQPPLDSDDEQENEVLEKRSKSTPSHSMTALSERDPNAGTVIGIHGRSNAENPPKLQFRNKAFTCCIKQYGVKVGEDDPTLANAGNGKRWKRQFGLFGARIN